VFARPWLAALSGAVVGSGLRVEPGVLPDAGVDGEAGVAPAVAVL
jgi:hypothetical protein